MKKLILSISSALLILFVSGCQNITPTPQKVVIDPSMPTVKDIKILTDMTEVAFEWKPVYNDAIKGYYIYRSDPLKKDGKLHKIATIDDRYVSHYVDTKLVPGTTYFYKMSTFSDKYRESEPSEIVEAKTMPLLSSVPFIKAISGLPHRIKIIWRPDPNPRVAKYIIQRNDLTDLKWTDIAIIDGRLNAEYIDKDLPDNKTYRYRVKVETYDGIVSTPSQVVEGSTKPLPPMVTGLRASRDLPKRIELRWDKNPRKDIAYYKVYRAVTPYLFYSYLAKTKDTKFDDLIGKDGVARYYKVTAVDDQGLESPKQENPVMGTTLSIPKTPIIKNVVLRGSTVVISWEPGDDRAVKYTVIKRVGSGFDTKTTKYINIYKNSYVDVDIVPGMSYKYSIIAIDKYGIESEPSEEISIEIPKGNS
ncbi:MAG: fibronectin type III domain-containing protein [Epsilonproteobacteria bacterium]|nr:fibronectin type III domain-containing protein [Campylobacterota bacterium]